MTSSRYCNSMILFFVSLAFTILGMSQGFTVSQRSTSTATNACSSCNTFRTNNVKGYRPVSHLYMTSTLPEISSMRIKEMREELESYGISTKSFLEKSEFKTAIESARAEGKVPMPPPPPKKEQQKTKKASTSSGKSKSESKSKSEKQESRKDRLDKEIEKCKSMKVAALKKELASYGISTKSFFEKTEFVKACAEARVDKVKGGGAAKQEEYDPSYRDVVMQKMGNAGQMMDGRSIIDVRLG